MTSRFMIENTLTRRGGNLPAHHQSELAPLVHRDLVKPDEDRILELYRTKNRVHPVALTDAIDKV